MPDSSTFFYANKKYELINWSFPSILRHQIIKAGGGHFAQILGRYVQRWNQRVDS